MIIAHSCVKAQCGTGGTFLENVTWTLQKSLKKSASGPEVGADPRLAYYLQEQGRCMHL